MVGSIYEVVRLVGGLRGNHFTTATTSTTNKDLTAALATNGAEIILYDFHEGESTIRKIPWTTDDNRKPVVLAFNPTGEWLLVASEDGTLFVVPLVGVFEEGACHDSLFKRDDVMVFPPNGSRARPTSLVWWQTLVGDASLAIIGTELGELSFIELTTGKEVGGTYITVPVKQLHLCRDNLLDTVFLLITGTEDRQWRLVLEQRSTQYLFPLEHITPEWPTEESPGGSIQRSGPPPRSRLLGLKQLSVEKLQMLRQRLAEAKTGTRRKPLTENKGVDTCDIDEFSSTTTPENTMTTSTTSIASGDVEVAPPVSARPERLGKFIHDVVATPHYAKERYLLAGHCKPNTTLMVYSTDMEQTPLYVFKIVPDVEKVILFDELIFVSDAISRRKITLISTFFSSSNRIDGVTDSKVNPVVQEIELPEEEEILAMFPSPPLNATDNSSTSHSGRSSALGGKYSRDDDDDEEEEEVELPTHTWPQGCLILTNKSLYICQPRSSAESMFMDLVLRAGDIDGANKLGVIFSLDPKLFELAADVKLRSRNFSSAIALYKHSRCPHVKCSIKFAAQGMVNEFLTYMGTLTSGVSGPDLGADERRNLANLAIICHLHHLCLPIPHKPPQQQQALRNLLLFLRDNQYYDEVLALTLAAGAWRWETLQYLTTSRGLYLEKLRVLLGPQVSPVIDSIRLDPNNENTEVPLAREKETGYLHCISDPELRQVLLIQPSLSRKHIALVLGLLATLEIPTLRRLADLYNPTHLAIRPFLQNTNGKKQGFSSLSSVVQNPGILSYGSDEIVSLESFVEVFLAIVIQLNFKRGWKYNSNLLTYKPAIGKEIVPIPIDKVRSRVLSCGYGHTAVIIGNTLYTWGMPDYGVLGHGPRSTTNHRLYDGMNISLPDDQENCVNGTVGQGRNNTTPMAPLMGNRAPPQSFTLDGTEPRCVTYFSHMKILSVACGKNHMLAITDNGVYGWGSSRYGQVGTGGTGRFPRPTLVGSLEGKGIIFVSCGQFHSLAVSEDGKLYTWGWGVHGQLGNGSVEDCLVPTLVKSLENEHIVVAEGGYAHSVVMCANGNVYAWGCGTYGQVGNGGIIKVTSPSRVCLPAPVTHLTAGYFQNIAVTKDHKVYVWGINPACLRVQAQLQRRGRMMQQQAEEEKYSNCKKNSEVPPVESKEVGPESNSCTVTDTSSNSNENHNSENGANNSDGPQIVVSGENSEHVCDDVTKRTTNFDDDNDTITTLPEDEDGNSDEKTNGAKSFIISPEPSPDKSKEDINAKFDINGDATEDEVKGLNAETSSSTKCPNSNETSSEVQSPNKSTTDNHNANTLGNQVISANTVPSCDPSDLGHLLPQEVEMPHGFGAVRSVACGSQHSLLLTTHGSLYAWGRNMSGQLGTGNRRELLTPTRILDDVYITDIACGQDFTLAIESQGPLWGWGSNYYSQLGKTSSVGDDKDQANRVFMLRTTKRVLKVPHSVHTNCETPRTISGLPPHPNPPAHHFSMSGNQETKLSTGSHCWLSQVRLETVDPRTATTKGPVADDVDDGLFGDQTLHTSLVFFHNIYNIKNITNMLREAEAHQALATVYTLDRQYSQAMHHQLYALFKQKSVVLGDSNNGSSNKENSLPNVDEKSNEIVISEAEKKLSLDKSLVDEAMEVINHYLTLQTEESQTGMKHVLQEGISLWLSHSLPLAQLEDLLLTHLPRTVYPLALLLFGDGTSNDNTEQLAQVSDDPAMKVLSQLSTKFCLNLCSSVITHLQAGGAGGEYVEALAQVTGVPAGNDTSCNLLNKTLPLTSEETSQLDATVEALAKKAPDSINLSQDDVLKLQREDNAQPRKAEKRHSFSSSLKMKSLGKGSKESDKDSVLFTCGHHFTMKDFKARVLPQMETSVMSVPGLLGKTARVLLDQYHTDQPEMACPHCVLAHLTIKLTKHKQT